MQEIISFLWYELAYLVTSYLVTLGFSLKTEGRSNIPMSGPVLVIANHQSFLDPVVVGQSTRRHLIFLARKTLFKNAFFSSIIRSLDAVPIDQEGIGKEGLKTILKQLSLGKAVLVFPEGTRTPDGTIQEIKAGIHLLIRQAKVPIIPVGIAGAYEAWPFWRKYPIFSPLVLPAYGRTVAVSVGKALDGNVYAKMPRKEALKELGEKLEHQYRQAKELRRKK